MKIKEIKASISGAIPIASYENLKPYYEIVADVEVGEDVDVAMKKLRSIVPGSGSTRRTARNILL